ncbi:MAG TPA: hypothetical protein VMT24_09035, partial [Aggregatilineaceae bacterium]|nr:hypothetical protein [Aggregatilineaceae bacterium]
MQASSSSFPRIQSEWLLGLVAVVALVLSGALLVVYGYAALSWYHQPFLGVLPLRTLQVSPNESLTGGEWPALRVGIQPGDQIDRLDGVDLGSLPVSERLAKFRQILGAHRVGDRSSVSFLRGPSGPSRPLAAQCMDEPGEPGLRRCGMLVWLGTMPTGDMVAYFGVGWVCGLVLWLVTTLLLLRQASDPQVRLIAIVSAVIVVFLAGRFDTISTHEAGWAWLLLTCLGAGLLVVVAMEFPYRFAFVQQVPLLGWAPMIVALALGGASAALYFSPNTTLNQAAFVLALGTLIL